MDTEYYNRLPSGYWEGWETESFYDFYKKFKLIDNIISGEPGRLVLGGSLEVSFDALLAIYLGWTIYTVVIYI